MVAAPTQSAERAWLYPYPSNAALYSQLPTCEAALAPISARATRDRQDVPVRPGRRLSHRLRLPVPRPGCRHHRGPDPRFCGGEVSGAAQQRLAAQPLGDAAGLTGRGAGGLVVVHA